MLRPTEGDESMGDPGEGEEMGGLDRRCPEGERGDRRLEEYVEDRRVGNLKEVEVGKMEGQGRSKRSEAAGVGNRQGSDSYSTPD